MNKETDIIYADIKHETDSAFKIADVLPEDVWIPKSQIENLDEIDNRQSDKCVLIELPVWLLIKKGLL